MSTEKAIRRWTLVATTILIVEVLAVAAAMARDSQLAMFRDDDWERLGDTMVKHRAEKDEIKVGGREGTFRKIRLEVHGADVEIFRLTVVYKNGGDEDVDVKEQIKDGKQTRAIDLKGGDRVIKKVVLFYKTDAGEDRKARVVLFGRE